jgi:hypothetical protein
MNHRWFGGTRICVGNVKSRGQRHLLWICENCGAMVQRSGRGANAVRPATDVLVGHRNGPAWEVPHRIIPNSFPNDDSFPNDGFTCNEFAVSGVMES